MSEALVGIPCVKMFELSESLAVKENQYRYNLRMRKPSRPITMALIVTYLMLIEFR